MTVFVAWLLAKVGWRPPTWVIHVVEAAILVAAFSCSLAIYNQHIKAVGARECRAEITAAVEAQKAAQQTIDYTAHQAAENAVAIGQNVTAKAEEASKDVQSAKGADQKLAPDVLARLHSGLGSVRPGQAAASTANSGGARPAHTVPAAGR